MEENPFASIAQSFVQQPVCAVEPLFREDEVVRLGQLADLAYQVAKIQCTSAPQFRAPHLIVMGSDSGFVGRYRAPGGESSCSRLEDIARGRQYISALCRQNGFSKRLVNIGLRDTPGPMLSIPDMNLTHGEGDFSTGPALRPEQVHDAFARGAQLAEETVHIGSNVLALGFVSVGARLSAAIIARQLLGIPLGDSLSPEQVEKWTAGAFDISGLEALVAGLGVSRIPWAMLLHFGGVELALAVSILIHAASQGLTLLIDSYLSITALYLASTFVPGVQRSAILAHCEENAGMRQLAAELGMRPVIRLGLYASEGVGALNAYPIIQSALTLVHLPQSDVVR